MFSSPLNLDGRKNTKKQGDVGLGLAVGWFIMQGHPVFLPVADGPEDYDLVVELEGKLARIQVRTTYHQKENGVYKVNLRVFGGNRSGTGQVKHFDPERVDYLFAVTNAGEMYLIPSGAISARNSTALGKQYMQYKLT